MMKPRHFESPQAIELASKADVSSLEKRLWALGVLGLALLVVGWAVTFFLLVDENFERLGGSLLIVTLGAAGFAISQTARRVALNLEKRLRLRLLIHNMELENLAMRDDLTRLFNRRYFFERLHKELESAQALDRPLAVILMDVDSLKAVNDSYGHKAGDGLLANFGRFLLEQTRATDIPARIGGDEFAVILPDTNKRGAYDMIKRFLHNLDRFVPDDSNGSRGSLRASFGVSGYPWGGSDVDTLMQQADAAMYAHKLQRKRSGPQEVATEGEEVEAASALLQPSGDLSGDAAFQPENA